MKLIARGNRVVDRALSPFQWASSVGTRRVGAAGLTFNRQVTHNEAHRKGISSRRPDKISPSPWLAATPTNDCWIFWDGMWGRGWGGEQPVTDDGPCPCSIREYSVTRILFHRTLSPIYEKLALRLSRVGNIIKKNHLKKKVFFEKLVAPKRAVTPRNEAHRKGKSSRQPAKFLLRRD